MSKAKPMGFWHRSLNYDRQNGRTYPTWTAKQHRRLSKKARSYAARLVRMDA